MEFLHLKKDIPFMSYGKVTTLISLVTFIIAVGFLFARGLHFSVDFTGGTVMEVKYPKPADLQQVRAVVAGFNLGDVAVQNIGSSEDVQIRVPTVQGLSSAQLSEKLFAGLKTAALANGMCSALPAGGNCLDLRSVDYVGPSVGKELVSSGLMALGLVIVGIIAYLALRFELRFAVAAIIANMHDVVIILGCFAAFQWEFSLTTLAAVLAVLGYSVNESVVVFDRIRENFRARKYKEAPVTEIIDNAITTTMSRTVITHACTQMMVTSMLFFGGEALHSFALALTIGICFGIYSSVLVASPLVLMFGVKREHFIRPLTADELSASDGAVV